MVFILVRRLTNLNVRGPDGSDGPDGPLDARHHRSMPYITTIYELNHSEMEIYHEPFYQNQLSEFGVDGVSIGRKHLSKPTGEKEPTVRKERKPSVYGVRAQRGRPSHAIFAVFGCPQRFFRIYPGQFIPA